MKAYCPVLAPRPSGSPRRESLAGKVWALAAGVLALALAPPQVPTRSADLPTWKPWTRGVLPSGESRIPLGEGLIVVTAINQPLGGDYESIKRVDVLKPDSMHLTYSAEVPKPNVGALLGVPAGQASNEPNAQAATKYSCGRTVLLVDLRTAHEYHQYFCRQPEERYPGTTAITTSAEVLQELKTSGQSSFKYGVGGVQAALSGLKSLADAFSRGGSLGKVPDTLQASSEATCTLKRAEATDLAVPVLVDDQRTELPAVHAACDSPDGPIHFYFLDDPANPIALAWQLGHAADRLQVVKITLPKPNAGQRLEQQLASTGRAEVYGIYFDFAKDTIRPESEPVLNDIAVLLTKNPSWRLAVEGHTDNIGSDAYNLSLSQHRAAAVKDALVGRYHIAPDRLTPAGFGASRPKEPNDTLEGRARNRRVELVRQ